MAQTGYTPISLYYSTTASAVPTNTNLANGELAINITDGKLYYKDNTGTVQLLASTSGSGGSFTNLTVSGNLTLSGGTANGVAYLNGSKVLTTGSALTFDGTNLTLANSSGVTSNLTTNQAAGSAGSPLNLDLNFKGYLNTINARIRSWDEASSTGYGYLTFWTSDGTTLAERYRITQNGTAIWNVAGSEQMRLTSTGLGIGTSSPITQFVVSNAGAQGVEITGSNGSIQVYNRSTSAYGTMNLYANTMYFRTGVSPAINMTLDVSGNLGIGTSSPSYKLDVAGAARSDSWIGRTNTSAPTADAFIYRPADNTIALGTANTERLRLDSAGNLGLGVTPSAWSSSHRAFQLPSIGVMSGLNANSSANYFNNSFFNGTSFIYSGNGAAARYEQAAGVHAWYNSASGTAGNAITFTQAMTLDASGNLGVGTTSPVGILEASSATPVITASQNNITVTSDMMLGAFNAYSYDSSTNSKGGVGGVRVYASSTYNTGFTPSYLAFYTHDNIANNNTLLGAATERARIDSSGNLLVGTTSAAAAKLTIASTTNPALTLPNIAEIATVSATAATGTINYDLTTQSVLYYTTNASGNFTMNIRGNSGLSLNSMMSTGQSVTMAFLCTNGGTAYYQTAMTIDGTSVTPKWQGGTAPSSGNASSVDIYSYTIIKTGSATYTVFASQTKFA